MAKKTKKGDDLRSPQPQYFGAISKSGKKLMAVGGSLVVLGFFFLSRADPRGQNIPSILSPFFLISGYGIIAFGIVFPGTKSSDPSTLPGPGQISEKTI